MYSSDLSQIRSGLVNYIGAMLAAAPQVDNKEKQHVVAAIMLEEILNIIKDGDSYNMFAAKPLLRATSKILSSRSSELEKLGFPLDTDIRKQYNSLSEGINALIDKF